MSETEPGEGFEPARVRSGQYAPNRPLPRDPRSGQPIPDSPLPHTQLGVKRSRRTGEVYVKAREFGEGGRHNRDIDLTDHGLRSHPNPHQHRIDPEPGKRQAADPLAS